MQRGKGQRRSSEPEDRKGSEKEKGIKANSSVVVVFFFFFFFLALSSSVNHEHDAHQVVDIHCAQLSLLKSSIQLYL